MKGLGIWMGARAPHECGTRYGRGYCLRSITGAGTSADNGAGAGKEPLPPRSILVYVTSEVDNALGENVLKLPLLLALKRGFPPARITWVPGTSGGFYLANDLAPLVDGRIAEFITDLDIPTDPAPRRAWRSAAATRSSVAIST